MHCKLREYGQMSKPWPYVRPVYAATEPPPPSRQIAHYARVRQTVFDAGVAICAADIARRTGIDEHSVRRQLVRLHAEQSIHVDHLVNRKTRMWAWGANRSRKRA